MRSTTDINEIQQLSLVDFLARLGHYPVKKSGKEHFYHSMLRQTDRNTPSLAVWDSGGKWMDHGGPNATGIYGGGIVQLAQAYWPDLSFKQTLERIAETMNLIIPIRSANLNPDNPIKDRSVPGYAFELTQILPIGTNEMLTKYLQSRGILEVAKTELSEIYYRNNNLPDQHKPFYAAGWKNEHGNWEFADAKGFKSSIGAKGISVIPGSPDHAALFEGYMDYLSWRTLEKPQTSPPTIIVLNSVVLLPKAIDRIKDFPQVQSYFDNDAAGRLASQLLKESAPQTTDQSSIYSGYKDYNEYLMADLQIRQSASNQEQDHNLDWNR